MIRRKVETCCSLGVRPLRLASQILHKTGWYAMFSLFIYRINLVLQSINLKDLVALAVEGNVDGGNGEFVFVDGGNWKLVLMDGSNWELVDVDGSNWQVVTLGLESGIIGNPGQSDLLS